MKRLFCLFILCISTMSYAETLPDVDSMREIQFKMAFKRHVYGLLLYKDFQQLEILFNDYQNLNNRLASGIPLLSKMIDALTYDVSKLSEDDKEKVYWATRDKIYFAWLKAYPESQVAQLYRVNDFISRAWTYRGDAPVGQVSKPRLNNYNKYINQALSLLESKKQTLSNTPEFYTAYIEALKAIPEKDVKFDEIIKEATSKFPNYTPLYYTAVLNLIPKWGGDFSRIEQFALDSLKTSTAYGQSIYAQIYWNADYKAGALSEGIVDLDKWEQAVRDFILKFPDQWNINHFASSACSLGKDKLFSDLVEKLKYPVEKSFWYDDKRYWSCMKKIEAINKQAFLKSQSMPILGDSPTVEYADALSRHIKGLLYDENFYELEALFKKYNDSKQRTSTGYWLLSSLIDALEYEKNYQINKENVDWSDRDKVYARWQEQMPNSILVHFFRVTDLMSRAWSYRGNGFVNTVSNKDRERFYFYNTQAIDILDDNKEILKKSPVYFDLQLRLMTFLNAGLEPYWNWFVDQRLKESPLSFDLQLRLMTFLDGDNKTLENIYQEATSNFPDYLEIYYSFARNYLPKWGGSYKQFEQFSQQFININTADGASIYSSMYLFLYVRDGANGFINSEIDKKMWMQGVTNLIKQYPDQWLISKVTEASCHLMGKGVSDTFVSDLFKLITPPANIYIYGGMTFFTGNVESMPCI